MGHERLEGGKKALKTYGLAQREEFFLEGNFLKRSGYQRAKQFLKMAERPTAIFATNDYMAMGVYQALLEEGYRIPEEMALIGFNDIEFSSMKGIELSTIGQKKFEMGAIAVELLVERIEGSNHPQPAREVLLRPELIVRKTCGFHQKGYLIESRDGLEEGWQRSFPTITPFPIG